MREVVTIGSTITRSPEERTSIRFLGLFLLLDQERRNVGLEAPSPNTKDDEPNAERANSRITVLDDTWNRRCCQDDVSNHGKDDGNMDGLVTANGKSAISASQC